MFLSFFNKSFFLIFVFLGFAFLPEVSAQSKAKEIDAFMLALYESNQFNGSVLVIEKGNLVYHRALGWANYEKKDTLKTSTPFRLASVSKQFTAAAIMILKERGLLKFDDRLIKFLPELPYTEVTLRQLLQHQSGIPDYFLLEEAIEKEYAGKMLIDNWDVVDFYAKHEPAQIFLQGTKAAYSNTGYVFLAAIIERVTEQSYEQFIEENIFKPAQMHQSFVYNGANASTVVTNDTVLVYRDTLFSSEKEIEIRTDLKVMTRILKIPRYRAIGYEIETTFPNRWKYRDYDELDGVVGEKGICASTEDLMKWDAALYTDLIVSQSTLKEAFTPSTLAEKKDFKYGFGWRTYTDRDNVWYHHGQYRGSRTYLQRRINEKTCIVILSNRTIWDKMYPIFEGIEAILEGKPYKVPKPTDYEKTGIGTFRQYYKIQYLPLY